MNLPMTIAQLKQQLDIPVIVAPMFLVSGTALVIASCREGVVGTLPALNGRTSHEFELMLKEILDSREETKRNGGTFAPFGVNLIAHKTNPRLKEDLLLCQKYEIPLIITSLGAPSEVINTVHQYGGLVLQTVANVKHAKKAIAAGVDGIILSCTGAGGHAGTINPFAFIGEIRSFYSGFVALGGSISSGNQILATQVMGADMAYIGTSFIATEESLATDKYKEMVVDATGADIIYTDRVSGVGANFLRQSLAASSLQSTTQTKENFANMEGTEKKAWSEVWSAGQGVASCKEITTTERLLSQWKKEYKKAYIGLDRE